MAQQLSAGLGSDGILLGQSGDTVTIVGDALNISSTAVTLSGTLAVSGAMTLTGNQSIGNSSTDTIGFYGATPVAQITATQQAAAMSTAGTLISVNATNQAWAFTTSTQIDGVVRLVNRLRADLVTLGLITGS